MRTLVWILIVLAAWMLPMTLYAVLTAKSAPADQPVIYVPAERHIPARVWMVVS
jgi:hypothetical protein